MNLSNILEKSAEKIHETIKINVVLYCMCEQFRKCT